MKRGYLVAIVIALIILSVGAVVAMNGFNNPPQEENLNVEATETKLPILEIFSGTTEIKKPGSENFETAVAGQEVEVGSIVKTGADSRSQILYPNNSVTRLDENSEVVLEEYSQSPEVTKVNINSGRIWSRIAKLFGKEDVFETKTESLVASVRGTSYGHGILADGSNKITVSKSIVNVDCYEESIPDVNVEPNKKITTSCSNNINILNWGGDEANDEWFGWNIEQDKELDNRFGAGTYDDQPTVTPTPTPSPTARATSTPTPTPTVAPTQAPTTSPNNTPSPITISNVEVICNAYSSPCGNRSSMQLKITGNGFSAGANPNIVLISNDTNESSNFPSEVSGNLVVNNDGTMDATFSTSVYGNYKVRIRQYDQTAEKDINIGYYD